MWCLTFDLELPAMAEHACTILLALVLSTDLKAYRPCGSGMCVHTCFDSAAREPL